MSSDIEQASLLLSRLYEQICADLFEKRKKSTCYFQARKGNERTSLWLFWKSPLEEAVFLSIGYITI